MLTEKGKQFFKDNLIATSFDELHLKVQTEYNKRKACPNCQSKEATIKWEYHQGHGDCSYSAARVSCICGLSFGDRSNYGRNPSTQEQLELWKMWNEVMGNLTKNA